MNFKSPSFRIILVSIVFAIAIIISSLLISDEGDSQVVMFILIAIWWIPFTYFLRNRGDKSDA